MTVIRYMWCAVAVSLTGVLTACAPKIPSMDEVLDSKLLDRRVEETPRQRSVRECQQESTRFGVKCTHCHTSDKELEIKAPDALLFTPVGKRAHIMRKSPTFGLHQQCTTCHRSEFVLNDYAQKMFGPDGSKHRKLEEEMNKPVQ